jgi:DNA invertase Pin-like site-specific DNA recombinase
VLIGYARVSKTEQNLDLQIDALKAAGCDPRRIFTDKQSGAKWDRRGLDAAMSHLREGDTLVVWKMDRLGRTVLQSVQFLTSLHQEKIEFRSLTGGSTRTRRWGSSISTWPRPWRSWSGTG